MHPEAIARLQNFASHLVTPSGDLLIDSDQERSQGRNKDACFEKLRELLILAAKRPKTRRATKPSRGSKERRIEGKKIRGNIKRGRTERFE